MPSNIRIPRRTEEWLGAVGKDSLQDFQDLFVSTFGIPILLVDTQGSALLVPSLKNLFCDFVKSNYDHECSDSVFANVGGPLKRFGDGEDHEPYVFTCDFGITRFVVPIYFNCQLMAFWRCDGFIFEDNPHYVQFLNKFDMKGLDHEGFDGLVGLLVASSRLLNIRLEAGMHMDEPRPIESTMLISDKLTKRENEIAGLVCCGLSNREIAEKLYLSDKTVKTHMSNILAKLGVRNRMQLIYEHTRSAKQADPDNPRTMQ